MADPIIKEINNLLVNATGKITKLSQIHIEYPQDKKNGDYSSNIALQLSKQLKKPPIEVAKDIVKNIKTTNFIEKIEVAHPGFINFYIKENFYKNHLNTILKQGKNYGRSNWGKGKIVVIDYSSPNIAKRFSIGHLRSTIIGQALYNIYDFCGWKCIGDNHLGDWGTQFGVLIYMVEKEELDPTKLNIDDWETLYVDFHMKLERNPTFKEKAQKAFKKLEDGDKTARNIWKAAISTSLKEYKKIYDLLEVKIDYSYGESFYEDKMPNVIKKVKALGIAKKNEGAWVVNFNEKYNLPSTIIVKSNNATTYLTRDLALMFFRKKEWNPNLQIFEVGADQTLYFQQVFALAETMNLFKLSQLKHVAHGMIRLKEGKMSTRKGKTVKLENILREAIKKATEFNQDPQIAKIVGIGAVKYNDLKRSPTTGYVFNWEEMLNLQGNSGPYIQYTAVRCKSILNKSKDKLNKISLNIGRVSTEEIMILKQLYRFPEVVINAAKGYSPHNVCTFLYELAQKYNTFYNEYSILKASNIQERQFRLMLTKATAQVLENGLNLLGIKVPEKM